MPTDKPVSVIGDVQAQAGGVLSSAHIVVVAPWEVQANVAVADDVVAGGCCVTVMVGSAVANEAAAGMGRAGAPPARMPPIATAAAEAARKRARDIRINSERRGAMRLGTNRAPRVVVSETARADVPKGIRSGRMRVLGFTHSRDGWYGRSRRRAAAVTHEDARSSRVTRSERLRRVCATAQRSPFLFLRGG